MKLSIPVLPIAMGGKTTSMSFLAAEGTPELSVAVTLKFQLPACVGMPEIAPVELFSVRPGGRAPAVTAHVYPPAPPAALKFSEHDVAIRHPGAAKVITTGAAVE
jgi:hypothetical protein